MSKKRPRVPLTFSDRLQRLVAVAQEHIEGPAVYYQAVRHDDDCPALKTQSLRDCTCEPEFAVPEKIA